MTFIIRGDCSKSLLLFSTMVLNPSDLSLRDEGEMRLYLRKEDYCHKREKILQDGDFNWNFYFEFKVEIS